jgi:hypothetical protein
MQSDLNLQQGEINMLIMDMPNVPPQYAPVVIAQAEQAQPQLVVASAMAERTIGVCQLIQGADMPPSAFNGMSPTTAAWIYLRRVENLSKVVTEETLVNAKTTLLKGTTHGTLKYFGVNLGEAIYQYYPDSGYKGADQATFLVEMGNYKVTLIYHFKVGGEFGATDGYNSYDDKKNCPNGRYWKISTTQDANGSLVVNSVDYLPAAPTDTLTSSSLEKWGQIYLFWLKNKSELARLSRTV